MTTRVLLLAAATAAFAIVSAHAAPSLLVTKPPVTPNPSYTGPTNDPHAVNGQWFRAIATSNIMYRTCEFHDNTPQNGGGLMGHLAIAGVVTNVQQSLLPPFGITGFDVDATIVNDTPGAGTWAPGTNSHGEALFTSTQMTGTLRKVMFTADFAVSADQNWPTSFDPPYRDVTPKILAVNHTHEAWYCWAPDSQRSPEGGYYVPAWSFGDIAPGQAVTVRLSFTILGAPTGLDPQDPRAIAIIESRDNGTDILANRTLSLKISNWQDDPALDNGEAYPTPPATSSDVSVFHNTDELQQPPSEPDSCSKWSQPPDCTNGVDIESWGVGINEQEWVSWLKVADDWLCDGRPISGLRWWGSFKDWMTTNTAPVPPPEYPIHPAAFLVQWHTDIPATPTNLFSRPGEVLAWAIYPVTYSGQYPGEGIVQEEPWCVSELKFVQPGYYEHEYQYTLRFPATNRWIEKEGNIYWLSIQAVYAAPPATNAWGWKTTDPFSNWNDDAVRINDQPPATNKLVYPAPGWPPSHPYAGQSINMAYELLTDVCPRRTRKWAQPPDMVKGVNMPSFTYPGQEPAQRFYRADDWLCDGRRITDIHWWGSYLGYKTNQPGPVPPPALVPFKPAGFSIGWFSDVPTNLTQNYSRPGELIASVFVPLTNCYEVYYGTVLQDWPPGVTNYEHEFQYYVDLLAIASPWLETNGVVYWLGIQAVFPPGFIPEQGGPLAGWGWKTTPLTNRWNDASVVSNGATAGWQPAAYSNHPFAPQHCDLAFELTTDKPGSGTNWWNQPIVIRDLNLLTNSDGRVASVGDAGAGVQILQYSTNLLNTNIWTAVATNPLPLPAPYTNYWKDVPGTNALRFYRIMQK